MDEEVMREFADRARVVSTDRYAPGMAYGQTQQDGNAMNALGVGPEVMREFADRARRAQEAMNALGVGPPVKDQRDEMIAAARDWLIKACPMIATRTALYPASYRRLAIILGILK